MVFLSAPGADPAFDVFKLGEEMGFRPGAKLKYMALGQGMGPKAQEFIETGCARGLWIMLQVCVCVWLDLLKGRAFPYYIMGYIDEGGKHDKCSSQFGGEGGMHRAVCD